MKSYEFLSEDIRSKKLNKSPNKLMEHITQDCSAALSEIKQGRAIYKGIQKSFNSKNSNFYLTDPSKKIRKSRNTQNYYTLLLDNLPSWEGYPKRSQSLICTSSYSKATRYGEVYIVLPFNNSQIAICPYNDIWNSFPLLISSLGYFNAMFNNHVIPDKNYIDFIGLCFTMKNYLIRDFKDQAKHELMSQLISLFKKANSPKDIENAFNKIFDPIKNGFTKGKIGNIEIPLNREIWTDGKAYLIKLDTNFCRKEILNQ